MGRVATPRVQPSEDYLLKGLLRCVCCSNQMQPASCVDGTRCYSCGSDCDQPDVLAIRLEQILLFKAMVRGYAVLYRVGRHTAETKNESDTANGHTRLTPRGTVPWWPEGQLVMSSEELRRWQYCDTSNWRSILLAAFICVTVDAEGAVNPVWRHKAAAVNKASKAATR